MSAKATQIRKAMDALYNMGGPGIVIADQSDPAIRALLVLIHVDEVKDRARTRYLDRRRK